MALVACAPAQAKGLSVAVVTRTQADALHRKAIRVRVHTHRTQVVRLFATLRGGLVASRVRDVRVRRTRVVRLRLGRAGMRAMRTCGRKRVTVSAAPAGTPETGPGRAKRRSRTLRRDPRRCGRRAGSRSGSGSGGSGGGGGSATGQKPVDYATPADADR